MVWISFDLKKYVIYFSIICDDVTVMRYSDWLKLNNKRNLIYW